VSEYCAEHVEESTASTLAAINEWIKDINPKEHFTCIAGGSQYDCGFDLEGFSTSLKLKAV
jgi:hypothetical protein